MASRILVVDDESSLLFTLVANLELEGFEVREASNGPEALELVRQEKFDLVLSDIRMPGMNGVELFHKIREIDRDVPVVFMTAFAVEGLITEAIRAGAFTVLPKPFAVDHLISALTVAIKRPLVLVIDDDVPVADTTAEALRASGVRAEAIFDGAAALETLRGGSADVCVVDMVMPGMSGPDVVARIRELDPSIACIAISGHDVPAMFQRAAPHVVAIMRKPVAPEELVRAIAKARGDRRLG